MLCCRSTSQANGRCPVTVADLKDLYNNLMKLQNCLLSGQATGNFWEVHAVKPKAAAYTTYQKAFKHRRSYYLKEPFTVPGAPKVVLKSMVAPGDNSKTVEMPIDMTFTANDLERYDALNKTPELMNKGCKGKERFGQLLELLALDLRYLLVCDQLAQHPKEVLPEITDESQGRGVLQQGSRSNDVSDTDGDKTPPPPPPPKPTAASDFRLWQPYRPEAIPWNDLGFSDADASERDNFMPACAFFFYIDILPEKFPDVNNALHAAWQTKHNKAMSADALAQPPLSYDEQAQDWYKATIEYMQEKLTDKQRIERGMRGQHSTGTARTKAAAIDK